MSCDELIRQGDFVTAALEGSTDEWGYHVACGFLGDPDTAARALERFEAEEARFYSGVLKWMAGNEEGALARLKHVDTDHARALVRLIKKPQINVLSQLPWSKGGPTILLEGASLDPKFRVRNIGFGEDDLPNYPFADIHQFCEGDVPPDFFICNMVEWHQIPPNLMELDCPLIGHTSDFDVHIQAVYPWLQLFDHVLVCDHAVEYGALRELVDAPVGTFVRTFGHPFDMAAPTPRDRDIDVFVSGSLFAPYHPEKAKQIHQILDVPNLNTLFVNGHISGPDYLSFVERAKITPCYCRHWGGALTRAMESASLGNITLVQEGSVHTLWSGEEQGLFTYNEDSGVAPNIRHAVANYERLREQIDASIDEIRGHFDPAKVASQYFRFCTYLAAAPRPARDLGRAADITQKRVVLTRGWIPANGDIGVLSDICSGNVAHMKRLADRTRAPRFWNDMARELLLLFCNRMLEPNNLSPPKAEFDRAIKVFHEAVELFPDHLVLRFNLLRSLIHFGDEEEKKQGYRIALEILEREMTAWAVDPLDDVLPYDFCSTFFNYRAYFDAVVELLVDRSSPTQDLARLIYAAVNHYVGRSSFSISECENAVELDGRFPFYQLTLAKAYVHSPSDADTAKAAPLLIDLVNNSMLAVQAHWLLRRVDAETGPDSRDAETATGSIARLEQGTFLTEAHFAKMRTPYYLGQRNDFNPSTDYKLWKRRDSTSPVDISIVFVDRGCSEAAYRLDNANAQTVDRQSYEIVFVELSNICPGAVADKVDTFVSCDQPEFLFHLNAGFNVGLVEAQGRIVVFASGDSDFPSDFVESIRAEYSSETAETLPATLLIDAPGNSDGSLARGVWRSVVCPKELAISVQGFDQHEYFHGVFGGLEEFTSRIHEAGALSKVLTRTAAKRIKKIPYWHDVHNRRYAALSIDAAEQMWPRLFDRGRTLPLLPHLVVENLYAYRGSNGLIRERWTFRASHSSARKVQALLSEFIDELERTRKLRYALARVSALVLRKAARLVLTDAGYRRAAEFYKKRLR